MTTEARQILEEDWERWKERFINGEVVGEFPEADELRGERKWQAERDQTTISILPVLK